MLGLLPPPRQRGPPGRAALQNRIRMPSIRSKPLVRAYLGLGSNLGCRRGHLQFAVRALARHGSVAARSRLIETEPLDCPDGGPFLNACLCLESDLSPRALLEIALRIERRRGRRRPAWNAPRTLDIDILLYEGQRRAEAGLVIPHPRMCERRFVLEPLAEIAPEIIHPVRLVTVRELLQQLPTPPLRHTRARHGPA